MGNAHGPAGAACTDYGGFGLHHASHDPTAVFSAQAGAKGATEAVSKEGFGACTGERGRAQEQRRGRGPPEKADQTRTGPGWSHKEKGVGSPNKRAK